MVEPAYQIAYEAALRALSQQEGAVDSLRARAGTLIAAIAITSSFLGGEVLRQDPDLSVWTTAAIAFFFLAMASCILVLLPLFATKENGDDSKDVGRNTGWIFRIDPGALVNRIQETPGAGTDAWYAALAVEIGKVMKENDKKIRRVAVGILTACVSLVSELLFWTIALLEGRT